MILIELHSIMTKTHRQIAHDHFVEIVKIINDVQLNFWNMSPLEIQDKLGTIRQYTYNVEGRLNREYNSLS